MVSKLFRGSGGAAWGHKRGQTGVSPPSARRYNDALRASLSEVFVARSNAFVALLRAVNVGGTGKLAMKDLCGLCTTIGFADVQTYIQSGNVVFKSALTAEKVRAALERALADHMGKPVDVIVRDAAELRRVLDAQSVPQGTAFEGRRSSSARRHSQKISRKAWSRRAASGWLLAGRRSTSTIPTAWAGRS